MTEKYSTIYLDPAWKFKTYSDKGLGKSADRHYSTMTISEMKKIPLPDLMAKDCAVLMWVTWPTMPQAFELATSWNLKYKTCAFLWAKVNKRQIDKFSVITDNLNWFFGTGYYTRANTEPCLLFSNGTPKRKSRSVRQLVVDAVRKHSQKPDRMYSDIEALFDGPYAELFARNTRPGWSSFGNEIDGKDLRDLKIA